MGIPVKDWIAFLRKHSDRSDPEAVAAALERELRQATRVGSQDDASQVLTHLSELVRLLAPGDPS